jgi:hypothetical protein
LEKVRSGKLKPKKLEQFEKEESDILPLQIKYRAFLERNKRQEAMLGKNFYPWQLRARTPKEISTMYLKGRKLT